MRALISTACAVHRIRPISWPIVCAVGSLADREGGPGADGSAGPALRSPPPGADRRGHHADLVLFDPEEIGSGRSTSETTYLKSARLFAESTAFGTFSPVRRLSTAGRLRRFRPILRSGADTSTVRLPGSLARTRFGLARSDVPLLDPGSAPAPGRCLALNEEPAFAPPSRAISSAQFPHCCPSPDADVLHLSEQK